MLTLFQFTWETEKTNQHVKSGSMAERVQNILKEAPPKHAFFTANEGCRSCMLIYDIDGAHRLPEICEPWFLSFNAKVTTQTLMTPEDLEKAGPKIGAAAKKYA